VRPTMPGAAGAPTTAGAQRLALVDSRAPPLGCPRGTHRREHVHVARIREHDFALTFLDDANDRGGSEAPAPHEAVSEALLHHRTAATATESPRF
jgi:hypothetical protein